MKTKRNYITGLLSIFVLTSGCIQGEETNKFKAYDDWQKAMSEAIRCSVTATNGLKLGFIPYLLYAPQPSTNTVDQPILLSFSLPGKLALACVPNDEYVGQFTLYDMTNHTLPKTTLGESFKLKANLQWDKKIVRQHHITGGRDVELWGIHDGWSRPLEFPSPSKLFEIKNPGKYRLILEIQVFSAVGINHTLVRFPPLEIPVVQPEKTNSSPK